MPIIPPDSKIPKNLVSEPPVGAQALLQDGKFSRPWAVWFRDVYNRIGYKGGNAIDASVTSIDEVITQININTPDIATNAANIATNVANIALNAANIATNVINIALNAANITTNAANITTNAADITTNAADITTNAADITTNAADITTNAADITTNAADITTNANNFTNFGCFRAVSLAFEGINTVAAVTPDFSYNLDTFARISTGVYEGSVTQTTFFGVNIFTNAVPVIAHKIADSGSTDFFEVEFTDLGSGDFRLEVFEVEKGAGNDLTRTLYDPDTSGDTVSLTLLTDVGNGSLPAA